MKKTMSYLKENVQAYSYIFLMCVKDMELFYEKFGFFRRPVDEYGCVQDDGGVKIGISLKIYLSIIC